MTVRLVLDASVALSWCFEDEADAYSRAALEQATSTTFLVPSIWSLEVINVLLVGERRGRITSAASSQFLELLAALSIEIEPEPILRYETPLLEMARRHHLSAYDASYLRLALKHDSALVTKDSALTQAAQSEGITIWMPDTPMPIRK
ncbi:MAG: type II toxin-antitoxin system VapC family toxin [Firmicutes bacterium]|nr:type II toxin-antitoxin system VapC family toxin [Bacillota bacterium]